MAFLKKEAWNYALLLIILFAIAALAVWRTISYIEPRIDSVHTFSVVAGALWALTLGLMLLAGAFGIWAIEFSAAAESRRRIGRFVDTMDYLQDGLIAVDQKGHITGSNPAIAKLTGEPLAPPQMVGEFFNCLSDADLSLLLDPGEPHEVERTMTFGGHPRALRFRSQPSEGLALILISDVTSMNELRQRTRQAARLQLIGQIARGVAHDFSNILYGISGQASLLTRVAMDPAAMRECASSITRNSEKGIALAVHLLQLSESGTTGLSTEMIDEHVGNAAEMLRDSLPPDWHIECTVHDRLPAIALTGMQLEQVVFNLGIMTADDRNEAGVIRICVCLPGADNLCDVGSNYAGVVLITAAQPDTSVMFSSDGSTTSPRESGVIPSVIASMLDETGGRLDRLAAGDGSTVFRVLLPRGRVPHPDNETGELADELKAYIAPWAVLLAAQDSERHPVGRRLGELRVRVQRVDNIMSALAHIEGDKSLDAVIIEKHLLGREATGLLKAILKLRPSAGLVVLTEDPEAEPSELAVQIVFESIHSSPDRILTAMMDAKGLAVRRKNA